MNIDTNQALGQAGMAALKRGDLPSARELFKRAVATGTADIDVWLGYAQTTVDAAERDRALDVVLKHEPGNLWALIMRGDDLAKAGKIRAAAAYYSTVGRIAPEGLHETLAREVERARVAAAQCNDRFADHLIRNTGDGVNASPRFAQSIDLLLGRRQVFSQQPKHYYFPELPLIQFYPREAVPFLDDVEAAIDDIRAELLSVMNVGDMFEPYVQSQKDWPQVREMSSLIDNPDWSAFYLVKDGAVVPENAERCPKTLAALKDVPLTRIEGRTPSILFSLLRPHSRIPPHNGFNNARLICHLPLLVPGNCGLRVGNETRDVVEGQAWAFDDSIEHEAWNDSDSPRAILLFDVWRPELSEIERDSISKMFRAIDNFA